MTKNSANARARAYGAEALGTAFLLMAITGSGVAADRYAVDQAMALFANAAAIGAALAVLIVMLAPISGAHFNPAVTLIFRLRGEIGTVDALIYALVQIAAGVAGVLLVHLMFAEPILQVGMKERGGAGAFASEMVATFGLVTTILFVRRARPDFVAMGVGLFIFAAIWFTASTAFANPAVTLARALTDTYVAIRPFDVPGFILAQLMGAALGAGAFYLLGSDV